MPKFEKVFMILSPLANYIDVTVRMEIPAHAQGIATVNKPVKNQGSTSYKDR